MPVSVDLPYDDDDDEEEDDDEEGTGDSDDGMGEVDDSVVMAMMKLADAPEASHPEGVDSNEGVGGDDDGSSSSSRAVSDSSWENSEEEDDESDDDEDVDEDSSAKDYADDEERGCHRWSASPPSSYSTDSASCSSSSSSSSGAAASSADASQGSHKARSGSWCPRKRCLWQVVLLVIIVAIPLGLVYRFYRSRHPLTAKAATRKAVTYPPFLSSSPTPSPTSYAPTSHNGDGSPTSNDDDDNNHNNNSTMLCNGHASLCSTPANQVLFATLHNGHAASDSGFAIFPNQERSLEDALEAGFRGVNVDVGRCDHSIRLTHTYCFLGSRDPVQVFAHLDSWLDENPHEVLLLPVQVDSAAGGPVTLEEVWDVLLESGNFVDKLYVRNLTRPTSEYPTLQQLIERNQRVLFFIYNGEQSCADLNREQRAATSASTPTTNSSLATTGAASASGFFCPDGMYDWFGAGGAAAETEYDFATLEAIADPSNSCRVTRGSANDAPFFGVNVFLSLPTPETSTYLNGADFLGPHLEECARLNNRTTVSAVMVDFWDRGDVLEVVRDYNSRL